MCANVSGTSSVTTTRDRRRNRGGVPPAYELYKKKKSGVELVHIFSLKGSIGRFKWPWIKFCWPPRIPLCSSVVVLSSSGTHLSQFPPPSFRRIYCEMYTCDSPLSVWGWKLKQLSLTESSLSSRRFGATLEIPWTIPVFLILFVHMSIFIDRWPVLSYSVRRKTAMSLLQHPLQSKAAVKNSSSAGVPAELDPLWQGSTSTVPSR